MFQRIMRNRLPTRGCRVRRASKLRGRTLLTHFGVRRPYHPFRSFEALEPRRVLSVFYDLSVITAVGDTTPTGDTIDSFDGFASINDNGRVAFTANVSGPNGTGSAV